MEQKVVSREALRRCFPNWARRVQPLPKYGCVYVRNAKAGSGTTMLWLHRVHTGDYGFMPEGSIYADHALPRPSDVGWDTVVRMLAGDAFRFSFVRDPIRRVESAYFDKVVRQRHPRERRTEVQRALGLPADPDRVPTFDQFVAALEVQAREPMGMDVHWRPQHLNLMHGLVDYDLVGRVETFEADRRRISEATGLPVIPVEVQHATRKPANSPFDGRPDLLRKVRDIYSRDFELYGYEA